MGVRRRNSGRSCFEKNGRYFQHHPKRFSLQQPKELYSGKAKEAYYDTRSQRFSLLVRYVDNLYSASDNFILCSSTGSRSLAGVRVGSSYLGDNTAGLFKNLVDKAYQRNNGLSP